MLNYLSAELYKLRRKKSLYIGIAALLVLESLLFTPSLWIDEMPRAFSPLRCPVAFFWPRYSPFWPLITSTAMPPSKMRWSSASPGAGSTWASCWPG